MGSGKNSQTVTIGYRYYMNIHFAIGHGGVQELLEVQVGGRSAWKGSIVSAGSAFVSQQQLFGGDKREGGVCGVIDFMPGDSTQPINPALQSAIQDATSASALVPAYRGITTLFFRGVTGDDMSATPWDNASAGNLPSDAIGITGSQSASSLLKSLPSGFNSSWYWTAMNPYFKAMKVKVRRTWDGWYSAKSKITINGIDHANPAHIIYECLTNAEWGLGYPTLDIDDTSFQAAADALYSEGFGLSLTWSNQTTIQDFINTIQNHINANVFEDRVTGLWRLKLIREDYDPSTLFEFNESNCVVESYGRRAMSDTINEVVVSYTKIDDGTTDTTAVQDIANFSIQGKIVSQKLDYPGICDPDLANRVAQRDLSTLSRPLAKISITAQRSAYNIYPGDVVKVNWPRLGIADAVFRVGQMDLGELDAGNITLDLIEDVFALPTNTYTMPQPVGWKDTARSPEAVINQFAYELSYYELYTSTTSADRQDWPTDVGFGVVSALRPNSDSKNLSLYDVNAGDTVADGHFTPTLILAVDCDETETLLSITIERLTDAYAINKGAFAWLDDELLEVTDIDLSTGQLTVNRSIIDTVPVKHTAGARFWVYGRNLNVVDPTQRVNGETADYKTLVQTSQGVLKPANASQINYTFQNRQLAPYRPGNLKVNAVYFPATTKGSLTLTWAHRDRTQETAGSPVSYTATDIGPETGVTYHVQIFDEKGNLAHDDNTIATNTFSYSSEATDLGKPVLVPSGIFDVLGSSSYVQTVLQSNPILYWRLDEQASSTTISDTSGNGYSANITSGVTLGEAGLLGDPSDKSALFDGSTGRTDNVAITGTVQGVEVWFNVTNYNSNRDLVCLYKSDNQRNIIDVRTTGLIGVYSGSASAVVLSSDNVVSTASVHHLVIYYDSVNNLTKMVLDAVEQTNTFSGNLLGAIGADPSVMLGGFYYGGAYTARMKGYLDEVAIYTGGMDTLKAQRHYAVGNQTSGSALLYSLNSKLQIKLSSVRNTIESFQQYDLSVERVGYGYNYGKDYGAV